MFREVFIAPTLDGPNAAAVLVHELIHAALDCQHGHKGPFKKLAPLKEHSDAEKRPGSRLIKVECSCCGYVARTTEKWLAIGNLRCPDGTELEVQQ